MIYLFKSASYKKLEHRVIKRTKSMNEVTPELEHTEQKKQLYLQRVNQLYDDINIWLKDEQLIVVPKEFEVIEALGRYKCSLLNVQTPKGKKLAEERHHFMLAYLEQFRKLLQQKLLKNLFYLI